MPYIPIKYFVDCQRLLWISTNFPTQLEKLFALSVNHKIWEAIQLIDHHKKGQETCFFSHHKSHPSDLLKQHFQSRTCFCFLSSTIQMEIIFLLSLSLYLRKFHYAPTKCHSCYGSLPTVIDKLPCYFGLVFISMCTFLSDTNIKDSSLHINHINCYIHKKTTHFLASGKSKLL